MVAAPDEPPSAADLCGNRDLLRSDHRISTDLVAPDGCASRHDSYLLDVCLDDWRQCLKARSQDIASVRWIEA